MKALSCFSTNMNPYRAGIELAEKLVSIKPEIIFLFPSIHYQGSSEMLDAIYDVLESDQTVLIGNTVDGFYEKNKVASVGVSALGLNSDGAVKWHLEYGDKIKEKPFEVTKSCMNNLNEKCELFPSFYFLVSDFRTDTDAIVDALNNTANGPVIGGLAADDYSFNECFIYANKQVLTNSIAILAVEGNLHFNISVANTLQPMGQPGIITNGMGTDIVSIDNIPAMKFIEKELGKPLEVVDQGNIIFKVIEEENLNQHRITGLLLPDDLARDKGVKLFAGIQKGKKVQVCLAPPEKILQDIRNIGKSLDDLPFSPVAAILVSCAGRKKVLADDIGQEVKEIMKCWPNLEALVGFPSFGEFGSLKEKDGYTKSFFHNMTFILLLIGEIQE